MEQLCATLGLKGTLSGTMWWLLFSYGGGAVGTFSLSEVFSPLNLRQAFNGVWVEFDVCRPGWS